MLGQADPACPDESVHEGTLVFYAHTLYVKIKVIPVLPEHEKKDHADCDQDNPKYNLHLYFLPNVEARNATQ